MYIFLIKIVNIQKYLEYDYHDLRLKTDVLLLADVFENFRKMCLNYYKLDAAHYFSAPGLAWDAVLKKSGVILKLFTNPDMYLFAEKAVRGGISVIRNRYSKANNNYMGQKYNKIKNQNILCILILITFMDMQRANHYQQKILNL